MHRAALPLLLALAACRTPPLQPGDGGACAGHRLRPAALTSISNLFPIYSWQTVHFVLAIPLGQGCDVLGEVATTHTLGDVTDQATVDARTWQLDGACDAPRQGAEVRYTVAFAPPQNVRLVLRDLNGAISSNFGARLAPMECAPPPPGQECAADCQCAATEVCAAFGGFTRCGRMCNQDFDCGPGEECARVTQSWPVSLCVALAGCCDGGCRAPFACRDCVCAPPPSLSSASCACQSDCPAGHLCDLDRRACVVPCDSDRACPQGAACAGSRCVVIK